MLLGTAVVLFLVSVLAGAPGDTEPFAGLGRTEAASAETPKMRFPGVPTVDLAAMGYAGTDLDRVTFDSLLAPLPGMPMQQASDLRKRIDSGSDHLVGLWEAEAILADAVRAGDDRVAEAEARRERAVAALDAARAELAQGPAQPDVDAGTADERERYAQMVVGMTPLEVAVADAERSLAAADEDLADVRDLVNDHRWAFQHTAWSVDETVRLIDHLRVRLAATQGGMHAAGTALAEDERGREDMPIVRVEGFRVHASVAASLRDMVRAARADGIDLRGKGFRSTDRQIELRRQNCGTTEYDIFEKPSGMCSPPTAKPHRSLHESGLAVDFRHGQESITSRSSPAFRWLAQNAAAYGFFNLPSEPWHWSVSAA